jgi:thiol:disulfide interchange protein DsbD
MGPALGFAVYQSNAVALLIFVFLGIGMAFPFLLLVLSPNIRNILPKPGKWMDEFKQFLAFPMFFTVVWLLWVIGRQTNITVMSVVIVGLILISMSVWSKKILDRRHLNKNISIKNLAPISLLVLAIILPFWNQTEDQDALLWESFDQARLEDLRSQGNPIFVNITADWCITCLANEKVAFTEKFYSQIKKNNITYLKGDWTNQDAVLTKLLNKHRRNGVPLYLMYPKSGGDPEFLPQILLEGILLKAIDRAVY